MDLIINDTELYQNIEKELRKGRKTKELLIKIACDSKYLCFELESELQKLKDEHDNIIQELKNKHEEELQKLKNEYSNIQKIKNERGAGRKPLEANKVELVKRLRKENIPMRKIAEQLNISVGSVHKILNEQ